MDSWQKELERTLTNASAGAPGDSSSLYDGHVSSSQHFGSSLPSLLQRQSSERSPWGYRGPHQWPPQMAWMSQHRAAQQVWGDPSFRQFFTDPSQDLQSGVGQNIAAGFRSPWEPTHDVKTIENVLNSVTEQPVNYRTNQISADLHNFRQQQTMAESLVSSFTNTSKQSPPTPSSEVPSSPQTSIRNTSASFNTKAASPETSSHSEADKSVPEPVAMSNNPEHFPQQQYAPEDIENGYKKNDENLSAHEPFPKTSPYHENTEYNQNEEKGLDSEKITSEQVLEKNVEENDEAKNQESSPSPPINMANHENQHFDDKQEAHEKMEEDDEDQDLPKDLSCDRTEEEPSVENPDIKEKENLEEHIEDHQEENYNILKNMTEKYGSNKLNLFESRKSNLENVLIKMNKSDEAIDEKIDDDSSDKVDEADEGNTNGMMIDKVDHQDIYDFETEQKVEYKPIKLKIARGEVVENTALETSKHNDSQMKDEVKREKTPVEINRTHPCALDKTSILMLQEKLETNTDLKERVKDIVGEDVLNIFASAVDEAETTSEDTIENKNVLFLYYAVKNSTYLDMDELNKNELEPLSNLALSIPLLSSLLTFLLKDSNIKEQIQNKIGKDQLEYFETVTKNSVKSGDEFVQDEAITPQMVRLYHSIRNLLLGEAFSRLTSLYSKTEHILNTIDATEDAMYNAAIVRLNSLVTAPWNQQIIAAEAMKFDFDFLNHVYNFWKKVIAKRNKPEKKPKKPLKIKPLPPMKIADTYDIFGRPKRSSRRRNEMVTYDEDIMQDCNIKTRVEGEDLPPMPIDIPEPALP